jgi:hypothetical protein
MNYYICASFTSYRCPRGQLCLEGKDKFLAKETSRLKLVVVMVYDAELSTFDPPKECSISYSFGFFFP